MHTFIHMYLHKYLYTLTRAKIIHTYTYLHTHICVYVHPHLLCVRKSLCIKFKIE